MNAFKIFLSIILIISEDIQNHSCSKTKDMNLSFFHNTNVIHHTLNKIFKSMKLSKSFKKSSKIQLLISMHKNLMNILKNSYKNNEADNSSDNATINEFSKHENLIDGILEDEYLLLFFRLNETLQQDIRNNTLYTSLSEHSTGQLGDMLSTIEKMTSQELCYTDKGFNNTDSKTNDPSTGKIERRMTPHNLKAWVPDAYQSFAFNRRIYSSKHTNINKYPFLASIHVSDVFVCGGSIIGKDFIITAASCLQSAYVNRNVPNYNIDVTVRIGSDFTARGGHSLPVAIIHFHPRYNPENLKNNLAIIKLEQHENFLKKGRIRRVMYDKTPDDLPSDVKRVTIVGWGGKDEYHDQSSKLALAHLDLYDLDECKAVYSKVFVSGANFCAGFITKGSGACKKDIGDPAVVAGVLVGVASFGPPFCGTPDAPTVFTRVGLYANWINSVLGKPKGPNATVKTAIRKRPDARTNTRKPQQATESRENEERKGVQGLGRINLDVPEEVFILQEILKDIATSNSSGINTAIEEGFNDEFHEFLQDHPNTDLVHHPLANKSMYGIPGANFPDDRTLQPINHFLSTKRYTFGYSTPPDPDQLLFTDNRDPENIENIIDVMFNQRPESKQIGSRLRSKATKRVRNWVGSKSTTRGLKMNQPKKTTTINLQNDISSGNYEDVEEGLSIEIVGVTPKPTFKITQMIYESADVKSDDEEPKTTLGPVDAANDENYTDEKKIIQHKLKVPKTTRVYDYESTRMMRWKFFRANEEDDSTDLRDFFTDINGDVT